MVDFYKALSPEARERVDRNRKRQKEIADMTLKDFIETIKYNYKNCGVISNKYKEGDPVYDAEMHYWLIPEMIKRLENKE